MTLLTKSTYMNGLQCPRLLWFSNQLPKPDLSQQHKFDQGHEFEEYVKQLHPNSIDLSEYKFQENLQKTEEAIKQQQPIFEAGFQVDDLFIRADLLIPNNNEWDLYEIKSTTSVKPQHAQDLAFQKYVLEQAGLKINKCYVIYLNKDYKRIGKLNLSQLIKQEEVTIEPPERIEEFLKILKQKSAPEVTISSHCNKPYPCPLKKDCWSYLPENNVLTLTNWRVYWNLFNDGILDINDIDADVDLSPKDEIIVEAVEEDTPILAKENIRKFLRKLKYPLYHFDFETFDSAIPLFNHSKPYQKLPFQYSLHIEQRDGSIKHFEFLAEDNTDPRPALLESLKQVIEGEGSVIVYNKSFEISKINELANDFPSHLTWLMKILPRIIDLAEPFKNFDYYHPSQKGKYSIKDVLPAITGKSYKDLEINNGEDANLLYFYSHIKSKLDKKDIRSNLLKYCSLDTEGMVWIIRELKKLV